MFYSLCTLAWTLAPGPFLGLMNNLFHGMDFSSLVRAGPVAWAGFFEVLIVLSAWALLAGWFFAWLSKRLGR